MNWYIKKIAQISSYSQWISPEGIIYNGALDTHSLMAKEIIKQKHSDFTKINDQDEYDSLLSLGYIRTVIDPERSEIEFKKINPRQKITTMRLINKINPDSLVIHNSETHQIKTINRNQFSHIGPLLQ